MPKLSIIVLSYNTKETTYSCLQSLVESFREDSSISIEVVVVDNASHDGSPEMLASFKKDYSSNTVSIITLLNSENVGYPKGNNQGVAESHGEYILFLNSDVIIKDVNWTLLLEHLDKNGSIGGLTVKLLLPSGSIDPASHRGFPTIWNAFSYYSGLERLTQYIPGLNRLFGGYHLKKYSLSSIHEIDSPSGAFYLTRRSILEKLHGFDETFFMYGEDLDLSYRLKRMGYKIVYYPAYSALHLKYQSGLKADTQTQKKTRAYFYDAMKIFYKKHYEEKNLKFVNKLVYYFIDKKSQI